MLLQISEGFRGGTETLERLIDIEKEIEFVKQIGNYNLVFTSLILIICLLKMWMVVKNGHRIEAIEKLVTEANERGRNFYAIGHRVQENQEYFRGGLDKAQESITSIHRRITEIEYKSGSLAYHPVNGHHNGHENKAANTVNINHPGEAKTPEQHQAVFWDYMLTQMANMNGKQKELERLLKDKHNEPNHSTQPPEINPRPRRRKGGDKGAPEAMA